jgi:pilus assembly protein CpaE
MMPLTAAFVISNRTVWEQAHACIQNLPVRLAVEQGLGQSDPAETDALLDRIERHRVDVVLVEASRIALPLEEFVRRIRSAAAQPAVFVLNAEASPELILEALRAGANEYLYPPLADTLRDALQKLSAVRSKGGTDTSGALGKIFGFLSVRGGCGATTFAVHVATEIARHMKQPMLLADCDFDAGLLRFLMKSKSTYSVRDALDNLRRMDSSLWKALVSSPADNLDVITAPEEVAAKRHPGREEMTHLMRFIRSTYPLSIVDFGRSVSPAALDALPELEALYLITTPDFMSLESAGRALQLLEERGFAGNRVAGNQIKVLLNKVKARETPDREGISKYLGRPCEAAFRNDHMSLYDAYSEGRFLPASSGLGKELRALADASR